MRCSDSKLLSHLSVVTRRRRQFARQLQKCLAVSTGELFYSWIRRTIPQRGTCHGWNFCFHGLDCSIAIPGQSREVRLEFGAGGRVDAFTVDLFHMKSSDLYVADFERTHENVNSLRGAGYIALADEALCERTRLDLYTDRAQFDRSFELLSEEEQMDAMICDRLIITPEGEEVLRGMKGLKESKRVLYS